jgi:hypothetical protein
MRLFCKWIKKIIDKWKKTNIETCKICGNVYLLGDMCEFCNAERRFLI